MQPPPPPPRPLDIVGEPDEKHPIARSFGQGAGYMSPADAEEFDRGIHARYVVGRRPSCKVPGCNWIYTP